MQDLEYELTKLSKALKQLRSEEKSLVISRRVCQLYVQMKLWSDDISVVDGKLSDARQSNDIRLFSFEPNTDLNNVSNGLGLGTLTILNRQNEETGTDGSPTIRDTTEACIADNRIQKAAPASVVGHAKAVIPKTEYVDDTACVEVDSFHDEARNDTSEGQWSPLNRKGKKQYDREFLLQIQFNPAANCKPKGLPDIPDIILDKPLHTGVSLDNDGSFDFTPNYDWNSGRQTSKGLPRQKKNNQSQGDPQFKQVHLSSLQDIEINRTKDDSKSAVKVASKQKANNAEDPDILKPQHVRPLSGGQVGGHDQQTKRVPHPAVINMNPTNIANQNSNVMESALRHPGDRPHDPLTYNFNPVMPSTMTNNAQFQFQHNANEGETVPTLTKTHAQHTGCNTCRKLCYFGCSRCYTPYCNAACQSRDWFAHRQTCRAINIIPRVNYGW